jgi:hypothetical protein
MLEKMKEAYKKILVKLQKMFDKILKKIWIKRKVKEVDFEEIFEDFYNSDISWSEMILEELRELFKKVLETWIMQEFNWNSYSLEIYNKKVIIINNFNNKIWRCELNKFTEELNKKTES